MKPSIQKIKVWGEKKNLLPKLVSIILAVILWGYLTSSKTGEVKFKLPVNYKNLDNSFTISRLSNKFVMVRVKGRKDELKNVNSKNIRLLIDLSAVRVGEYNTCPVQIDKSELSEDVSIDLNPDEIKLFVEKKIVRSVPVIPRHSGDPEKGYIMGQIKVTPEYVKVSGSSSLISDINVIYTEYIFLNNKNETFKSMVKLDKIYGDEVDYNISDVTVNVPIIKASVISYVEIPVSVKNRVKGLIYKTVLEKIRVGVVIPENRSSDSLNLVAYIDASEIDLQSDDFAVDGRAEKEAIIHVKNTANDDSSIISVTPDKVKVIITRE